MSAKARRFARNVGWSLAGQVAAAAANFLLIPYLVRGMGQAVYGLYILMYTATGYLLILTFGGGPTTVRFVAERWGAKDRRGLLDVLGYSAAVHLLVLLPAAAVLFAFARAFAVRLFHVPAGQLDLAVFALRCAAAGSGLASLVQAASCVLQGLQRFDWYNGVTGLQSVAMPLGAAVAIRLGRGLEGAASWYVSLNAAAAALGLLVCWRLLCPAADFPAGHALKPKTFLSYGASMWLTLFAWVVTFQCDKIFLARGTSLSDLTLYSVPSGLLQRVQVMGAVVSGVLLPMMSELSGEGAHETMIRMYLKSSRFLLWAVLPALILLFVLMPQFLSLWLGGEFGSRGVWPARLLVAGSLFYMLNAIPHSVVCSRGKPWVMTAVVWGQAVLSVALWKLLVPRLGILGVAWGSMLAQAVPTAVYLLWLHGAELGLGEGRYARETLWTPLASAALLALLVFPAHPFVDDWPKLILTVSAGLALYYGSTWFLLDEDDRRLLRQLIRREPVPAAVV